MATSQVNYASPSEASSDPPGNFPCFEQLFAGQAAGLTDGAANFVEQRVAREEEGLFFCQTISGRSIHKNQGEYEDEKVQTL